jgi:hypothetical protein
LADPSNSPKSQHPAEDDGPVRRVGTLIKGKWTVESLLGVGGMATVYAALHRNGQRAALKVLHLDFARDKTICERFLREGYVSNKIGHPACVAVLDDDRTEDYAPFLVMELLLGDTVRDLWKKSGRRMPIPAVLKICDDVLDCLAACHAIGVIHRDLKPANIFVTTEGITKVLDFGVAQMRSATAERTATGTALGTPAYMSPEQAMGLVDQLDGRADLFSIGAMMHALSTGHRINSGRTENEALVMAATTPVPSVARIAADLPVELIALIDKSLAWDRRNRYADAREMQMAVRQLLAHITGVSGAAVVRGPASIEVEIPPVEGREERGSRSVDGAAPRRASGAPGVAPLPAAAVPLDETRLEALRDLFKRLDRLLPSVRQFGWAHPATDRSLQQTYDGFAEALGKDPELIDFSIRPYSMMAGSQTIWEPGPPFDAIPYNLFACGIRRMRMAPGLTLEELRETLSLMLLDPGRDLPPEDDLAAAFWERGMPHVHYEVVDAFVDGDAAEREAFYNESDELERLAAEKASQAARIEAMAMAVATDRSALRSTKTASPMAVEDVVRSVFAQQLELSRDKWSERYVDAVVEGYVDAAVHRDAPLVLASLRKSAADLVVAGRFQIILGLHDAIVLRLREKLSGQNLARLSGALTNAMFGAETLELTIKFLSTAPDQIPAFEHVLDVLNANELPAVLAAYRGMPPPPLRAALLRFVERTLPGNETQVAAASVGADPDSVFELLGMVARAGTPEARQALSMVAQSEDMNVRVEAKVLGSGPADVGAELTALCENGSSLVRMAALRAITRHDMKAAWTSIARIVKQNDFNEKGSDERKELLRALVALVPERGEPIALDLARKAGVFVSEAREGTRVAALEALGEVSRSVSVVTALREIALARWGTSDETRNAAAKAVEAISVRIQAVGAGQGPYGSAAPMGVPS